MSTITVTTQEELDAALSNPEINEIRINSERGVWLHLTNTPASKYVRAFGAATVRASGSATVQAFDSATVQKADSATVQESGSATVQAFDSATVQAFGAATVEAFDSATVRAFGAATVRAFGSATVEAFDSATVQGFHTSVINAGSHVAVHLHSGACEVAGGVLIDHTAVDQSDPATWCSYHGVDIDNGHAVLYKAVREDWCSDHGTRYEPGTIATCDDFRADGECGGGLHISPTPSQAASYDDKATRFVEVRVALAGLNVIGPDKAKAATVECVREVDRFARPLVSQEVTA